jgi:predicted lipoprotein with Yx(FWY)xxD motif
MFVSRRTRASMALAGVAGLATAALAGGLALAKSQPTLRTASNATIGKTIVVNGHGLTVYELRPETSHHLLCTKASHCLTFWPPVTVASRTAKLTKARGVKGKLAILHRNGLFQVTLSGRPLYRYSGDGTRRGAANGQGIKSFGGTWHVVVTGPASSTTTNSMTTTTDTTTTDTTPTITYGYP